MVIGSERGGRDQLVAATRALQPGTSAIIKPLVVLAARFLGPGRLRLEMVKLAHDLSDSGRRYEVLHGRQQVVYDAPAVEPDRRAA